MTEKQRFISAPGLISAAEAGLDFGGETLVAIDTIGNHLATITTKITSGLQALERTQPIFADLNYPTSISIKRAKLVGFWYEGEEDMDSLHLLLEDNAGGSKRLYITGACESQGTSRIDLYPAEIVDDQTRLILNATSSLAGIVIGLQGGQPTVEALAAGDWLSDKEYGEGRTRALIRNLQNPLESAEQRKTRFQKMAKLLGTTHGLR